MRAVRARYLMCHICHVYTCNHAMISQHFRCVHSLCACSCAGAQNDLERVTKMAYAQVAVYGMNDKVR